MMNSFIEKIKCLFVKIKKVKHIEVYIAVGCVAMLAIVYFAFASPIKKTEDLKTDTENDIVCGNISSSSEYTTYLENKLENVISSIKGVEDAKVVVSLEKGFEYVYATEEETKTSSNGTSITKLSIVMVDGKPVIKEEVYPVIKGVVVVASGVEDVGVRMNVLSIIQTIIEVDNSKINILASKL